MTPDQAATIAQAIVRTQNQIEADLTDRDYAKIVTIIELLATRRIRLGLDLDIDHLSRETIDAFTFMRDRAGTEI